MRFLWIRAERDLQRELTHHLHELTAEYQRQGHSHEDALRMAKREFGGVEQVKEQCRDARRMTLLEPLMQDVRHGLRMLRRSPTFTAVAGLSLALGIGANTAIFSLIDSLILKALPVSHPEQLIQITMDKEPSLSNAVWEQLRDRQDVFSGIFAYGSSERFNLAKGGEARFADGSFASGQFFDTLGLHAIVGRTFRTTDDRRGCHGTAVLSYGFWRREYGGRSDIVGKTVSLNNHPFEVLGVLDAGFTGIGVGSNKDLYLPVCAKTIISSESDWLDDPRVFWLSVIGRPKLGISASQAKARLRTLESQVFETTVPLDWKADEQESYRKRRLDTQMATDGLSFLRDSYEEALMLLMSVVGILLLIACANVANLLMARNAVRQKEIAIRMALGSGRGRLVRQLLTESMVLSLSGAALGVLFAQWGTQVLIGFLSSNENKVFLDLSVDFRLLAFTAGVAILTGLLFGLGPAWRATGVNQSWR